MSYQLGYSDVLKALFSPSDPVGFLIIIGVFAGIPLLNIYLLKRAGKLRRSWRVLLVIAGILIAVILVPNWNMAGAGWQLTDGEFKLRAWPVAATLDVSAVRVALVENSGPWRPTVRTNGYGTPGLTTGWCRLANGKKAVVFRHLRSEKMVVIETGGRYYIISHPGVEKLYDALIAQGAAQWAIDTGERKGDV